MGRPLTMREFDAKAQELGTVGAAARWAQENGYELPAAEDTGAPQGGLSAVAPESSLAVGGGPEDEELEDDDGLGGLASADTGLIDFGKLNDPKMFQTMYQQQRAAVAQQEASAKQMFEMAKQRLQQRYAGPTRSDQMLALSSAMLSPRKVPGFAGFAGRIFGTFNDISAAERQAAQQREDQLLALQQQYQTGNAARAAAQQKGTLDLLRTYGAVNKPVKPRTGFNPITGELTDMDTGQLIENRALPTYTPQEVAALSQDPANRGKKFRTTDGRVMEIK